jgi:hypothetical protein
VEQVGLRSIKLAAQFDDLARHSGALFAECGDDMEISHPAIFGQVAARSNRAVVALAT